MFGKKANLVLFSVMAMLFFCVTTSYAGLAPKVFITKGVIKGGHSYAAGGLSDQFLHRWADIVAKKTNGDIKIEIYPAGQLGGYRETFELVQMGTVQFVWEDPSTVQPWDRELPGLRRLCLCIPLEITSTRSGRALSAGRLWMRLPTGPDFARSLVCPGARACSPRPSRSTM